MVSGSCSNCGGTACECQTLVRELTYAEVADVLSFLRGRLGLSDELSCNNVMRSLILASRDAIINPAAEPRVRESLPTFSSAKLAPILTLVTGSSSQAAEILTLARMCPGNSLKRQLDIRGWGSLMGLLLLYNSRYCGMPELKYLIVPRFSNLSEPDECLLLAMLLPLVYVTDPAISDYGYIMPKLYRPPELRTGGTHYVSSIHINRSLPAPVAKLVLVHELVHTAIWLSPYLKPLNHSHEEVLCNCVTAVYQKHLLADENIPHVQQILEFRTNLCMKASRGRNPQLLQSLSSLLAAGKTAAAFQAICSQPINTNAKRKHWTDQLKLHWPSR